MPAPQKLSEVAREIEAVLNDRFLGRTYWIKAEISDVKKYPDKKWCFLKFIEKEGNVVTTDIKGVFWSNTYQTVPSFERATGQVFTSGLEITCLVKVKFHKRYGLNLEVVEIDYAYAIGKLELERKQTIDRLIQVQALQQDPVSGYYFSANSRLPLPLVIQRIALITAPNSDGQRDFQKVVKENKYGFAFAVTEFLTQIQGDTAPGMILGKLEQINNEKAKFDIAVIARGGGSDTDLKSFNDFELANAVANFPIPVLTGIGHDRNTSITDLVARQLRTPTEAATFIVDHNMNFDRAIDDLKQRFFRAVSQSIEQAKRNLANYKQRVTNLSPASALKKGFAIVTMGGKIITDPRMITQGAQIETLLKNEIIYSEVTKTTENDSRTEL